MTSSRVLSMEEVIELTSAENADYLLELTTKELYARILNLGATIRAYRKTLDIPKSQMVPRILSQEQIDLYRRGIFPNDTHAAAVIQDLIATLDAHDLECRARDSRLRELDRIRADRDAAFESAAALRKTLYAEQAHQRERCVAPLKRFLKEWGPPFHPGAFGYPAGAVNTVKRLLEEIEKGEP